MGTDDVHRKRIRSRALWMVVAAIVLVLVIVLAFYRTQIQERFDRKFALFIRNALGKETSVGWVETDLDRIVISNVEIPIDKRGSSLRINEAIIDIRLNRAFRGLPAVVERIALSEPEFRILVAPSQGDSEKKWLPQFVIPVVFWETVRRFSGLKEVILTRGRIYYSAGSDSYLIVDDCDIFINRARSDSLLIHGEGLINGESTWNLTVRGGVNSSLRIFDILADVSLPEIAIPLKNSTKLECIAHGFQSALQIIGRRDSVSYFGSANLDSIHFKYDDFRIAVAPVSAILRDDILKIGSMEINGHGLKGQLGGELLLTGAGKIRGNGELHLSSWDNLRTVWPDAADLTAAVDVGVVLGGDLSSPEIEADAHASTVRFGEHSVDNAAFFCSIKPSGAKIESLTFENDWGYVRANGSIAFHRIPKWSLEGNACLKKPQTILGLRTSVHELKFEGESEGNRPRFNILMSDSAGFAYCSGTLSSTDNRLWRILFSLTDGKTASLSLESADTGISLRGNQIHRLIETIFPETKSYLSGIDSLDLRFLGDTDTGSIICDLWTQSDTPTVFSQIARYVHLDGAIRKPDSASFFFDGRWSGIAGNSETFEGQAGLRFKEKILHIDRCFIDDAGQASGRIDFSNHTLDLEVDVTGLSLHKLPIPKALWTRTQADATLSGFVRLQGPMNSPDWTTNIAMVDGAAFGVCDYWMNLYAVGDGGYVYLRNFELGRGVRKILEASGEIDAGRHQVAIVVEIGAARAEDFVLALTGRRGIISGELDGRGTIVGTLPGVVIEAELSVRDGELGDEIRIDEFAVALQVITDPRGLCLLSIPRCTFAKNDAYSFTGSAEIQPIENKTLNAQIEGQGDFLDILDQMDRTFRTAGSQGDFRLDFGGTLDHPEFLGGHLTVSNGQFYYSDATPGKIGTEIEVHINTAGVVDTGSIVFRSNDHWIQIQSLSENEIIPAGLQPIIIPGVRLNLGVLSLRTSENAMPLRIPGFMKPEWLGDFLTGNDGISPLTISTWDEHRLLFEGGMQITNARLTFPFVDGGGGPMKKVTRWIVDRLYEGQWNVDIAVGEGNRYDVEITGLKNSEMFSPLRGSPVFERLADYLDHLSIDAIIDPTDQSLQVRGSLMDTSFYLNGRLSSRRGKVDYLDQTFLVDYFYSDFDGTDVMPILEGRATTTGIDTLGRSVPVYLTMYQIDRETETRQKRGRLSNITYVLENEAGDASEQVLSLLGYDMGDVRGKAEELVATSVARAIGRHWLNPLARRLERWMMLDEVSLSPGKGRWSLANRGSRSKVSVDSLQENTAVRFFSGSQVTVGKYLTRDIFLTYTGELAEGEIELGSRMGFIHSWNLEYRIEPLSRDLVLDFAVEYDEVQRRRDESVSLKYSFPLEP